MARRQFWAIRNEFSWTRTFEKTEYPTTAILRQWPELTDDPIRLAALAPSPAERSPAERWAFTREVVGLGSAKRAAERLYVDLTTQVKHETSRRMLLKSDPETVVEERVETARRRAIDAREQLVEAIRKGARMATLLTQTYGPHIPFTIRREIEAAYWARVGDMALFGTTNQDAILEIKEKGPYKPVSSYREALNRVVEAVRTERHPNILSMFDHLHSSFFDHIDMGLKIVARETFLEDVSVLMRDLDRVISAHAVEREIESIRRNGPNV